MWPAEFVGQVHAVTTPFGPFECPLDRFWLKDWADVSSAGAQDGGQAALDACHAAVAAVSPGTNAGRGAAGQKEDKKIQMYESTRNRRAASRESV
jgi:hypothetical protein